MTIALSSRWEEFVAQQVEAGLFQTEQDVLEASLALMERQQAKLEELRATIAASEALGGSHSHDEVLEGLRAKADEWRARGF